MRERGYDDRQFWSVADWAWIKEHNIGHPHLWFMRQGQWFYRAMFEEVELPLDWPVYVSYAEAAAYARFAGMALPTEAQFHGGMHLLMPVAVTSTFSVGTRSQWGVIREGGAPSDWTTLSAMAGNGHPPVLRPFWDL